jgi:hypothetical protein
LAFTPLLEAGQPSVPANTSSERLSSAEPAIRLDGIGHPMSRSRKKKSTPLTQFHIRRIRRKLEENTVRNEVTGCLEWQGALATQGEYAELHNPATGHPLYGHHATLLVNDQPKPAGPPPPTDGYRWECHHLCRNRLCCEPSHLTGWIGNRVHAMYHAGERRARAAARKAAKRKQPKPVAPPQAPAAAAVEILA